MEKPHGEPCGCTGRYIPSPSLKKLAELLERAEARKREDEDRKNKEFRTLPDVTASCS